VWLNIAMAGCKMPHSSGAAAGSVVASTTSRAGSQRRRWSIEINLPTGVPQTRFPSGLKKVVEVVEVVEDVHAAPLGAAGAPARSAHG
jgi:hypothetical protein